MCKRSARSDNATEPDFVADHTIETNQCQRSRQRRRRRTRRPRPRDLVIRNSHVPRARYKDSGTPAFSGSFDAPTCEPLDASVASGADAGPPVCQQ